VILLLPLAAGLLSGVAVARWQGKGYRPPDLQRMELALLAFLPQALAFYIPSLRHLVTDRSAAVLLVASQVLFLLFVWLNRRRAGMGVLALGVILNLAVIASNSGLMPISPQTVAHLVPAQALQTYQAGDRFGTKDVLLLPEETRLEWLSDRFLLPGWFPYQIAFSLGDTLIGIGVFWLLASPPIAQRRPRSYVDPTDPHHDISVSPA